MSEKYHVSIKLGPMKCINPDKCIYKTHFYSLKDAGEYYRALKNKKNYPLNVSEKKANNNIMFISLLGKNREELEKKLKENNGKWNFISLFDSNSLEQLNAQLKCYPDGTNSWVFENGRSIFIPKTSEKDRKNTLKAFGLKEGYTLAKAKIVTVQKEIGKNHFEIVRENNNIDDEVFLRWI